jgi:hypothetical protein
LATNVTKNVSLVRQIFAKYLGLSVLKGKLRQPEKKSGRQKAARP